ncbi:hypothetical protein [Bradyrhizobium sp.]|uniref:hypothetical protein n=1 Tax=Bradyrhizobium sp. TaxID=376 RepID=UPI002DDCD8B7|nr:hypothetical protein [Bradyrhizobium sp.]HEV2154040.1 hypothetical protein [Bradyrhizobium sp.]
MSSYTSISSEKLFRHVGAPSAPSLVDVRIDERRAADLRIRQDGERRKQASTWDALGTTIKWRTP